MNSNRVKIFGYSFFATGTLFLVSSLVGFITIFAPYIIFYPMEGKNFVFVGAFWCGTHFFIGKYLVQIGKRTVADAEKLAKNLWLQPKYHLSTLKNLSEQRFRGYAMCLTGISLLFLFGVSCLFNILYIVNVIFLTTFVTDYSKTVGDAFGLFPSIIYFFLGIFFLRRGKRLALIIQNFNLRFPLFYLNYIRSITLKRLTGYILYIIGFSFFALAGISFISPLILAIFPIAVSINEKVGSILFAGGCADWFKGIIYIFVGRYILRSGKRFLMLSGEELLSIDKRPPVLYLRSFWNDDDMAIVPSRSVEQSSSILSRDVEQSLLDLLLDRGAFISNWIFPSLKNQEELIAKQLKRIGPPIAVGMPNEELPRLGMARMHFSDEEWRDKVTELINSSSLVVMLAGFTENFWWELETVVKNLDPKKLIILLPFETQSQSIIGVDENVNGYFLFQKRAETILPKQLPNFSGTVIPGSNLSGLMWFDSDWNPKIYELSQTGKSLKKSLVHVFNYY